MAYLNKQQKFGKLKIFLRKESVDWDIDGKCQAVALENSDNKNWLNNNTSWVIFSSLSILQSVEQNQRCQLEEASDIKKSSTQAAVFEKNELECRWVSALKDFLLLLANQDSVFNLENIFNEF